jgi:hypothetical protein
MEESRLIDNGFTLAPSMRSFGLDAPLGQSTGTGTAMAVA